MAREKSKTDQIGVRFDKDLLEGVVRGGLAKSPQHALNLYEKSYIELIELKVKINNEPINKERIVNERNAVTDEASERSAPLSAEEVVPPKVSKVTEMLNKNREKYLNK